jgi:hypothetical protein
MTLASLRLAGMVPASKRANIRSRMSLSRISRYLAAVKSPPWSDAGVFPRVSAEGKGATRSLPDVAHRDCRVTNNLNPELSVYGLGATELGGPLRLGAGSRTINSGARLMAGFLFRRFGRDAFFAASSAFLSCSRNRSKSRN